MSIDYELYPALNPDSAFNKAQARKGYVIYYDASKKPWSFRYSISFDGSYLTCASTMRGALRMIRRDRKKRLKPKKRYYENPIVHQEP
jgi:hypothetical protein